MKLTTFFIVFLTLSFFSNTHANHSSGSDSCGLGWAFTEEKTLSATSTRGTTNGFVPPTFGMSSGTLGCDSHSIAEKDIRTIRYIATYADLLKYEIVLGMGMHLQGLAQLMESSSEQCFAKALNKHYSQIASSGTPIEMFKTIQKVATGECPILI